MEPEKVLSTAGKLRYLKKSEYILYTLRSKLLTTIMSRDHTRSRSRHLILSSLLNRLHCIVKVMSLSITALTRIWSLPARPRMESLNTRSTTLNQMSEAQQIANGQEAYLRLLMRELMWFLTEYSVMKATTIRNGLTRSRSWWNRLIQS